MTEQSEDGDVHVRPEDLGEPDATTTGVAADANDDGDD